MKVVVAFALLYLFWGSTYLAIRIAVAEILPALMTGARFAAAGLMMLTWCRLTGRPIAVTREQAVRLAVVGWLLLSIGNTVLCWAEQWVPSGLAALMVAITPMWFLLLETWVFPAGYRISRRAVTGLIFGVIGIVILLWPELLHATSLGRRELFGCLSLLGGSLSWAFGSLAAKRWRLPVDPLAAAGYQMLFAGLINGGAGLALGEWARSIWSWRSTGAVIYLVIFGSLVGYGSYIWLLNHVSTTKVSTYAYVNPMVAVVLGWLLLQERITGYILAGSVVIVAAVALITGAKPWRVSRETELVITAAEGPGG